jgi:hypothetical protein
MVVESEGRQLVVAVSIEFLDQGGKATVTPGGQLAHGRIRPAEKIEAALEKLAVHRVDVFLVPIRIALPFPIEEQGLQLVAQCVMIPHGHVGHRDGEQCVYPGLLGVHRSSRVPAHGRIVIGVLSSTDSQISIMA